MSVKPKNLLFVFADQLRGMDLGCAGNKEIRTPNFDALAADGLRLTNAIANFPVCGPSRACMLTGQLPTSIGVPANDLPLLEGTPTLGTIAQANNCQTAYIGKWHLDGVPRDKFTPPGPRRFGFEHWAAFNCSHDYFRPCFYRDAPELQIGEGYEPEFQTELAIDFLQKRDPDKPFCLTLSWGPPHDPYWMVPEHFKDGIDANAITLRPNVRDNPNNPLMKNADCRQAHASYRAAIQALDVQFGRLIRALNELGLADETCIVFTSDHGDMLWSHGWMKKQSPYAESLSIPFIIRAPGIIASQTTCSMTFGTPDILPTLCGLMDWQAPHTFYGEDLSTEIISGSTRQRDLLIANYVSSDEAQVQGMPEWRGIHNERYTYVETVPGQAWLLFDNHTDPYQMQNLLEEPEKHDLQQDYRRRLHLALEEARDTFASGSPLLEELNLEQLFQKISDERYTPEFFEAYKQSLEQSREKLI